jgi:hypothetical protein
MFMVQGEDNFAWCCAKCFCDQCRISKVTRIELCPFAPYLEIFMPLNWHYAINQWLLHIGRHHYHSSWFGFISYFFSWHCYDNYNLSKRWSLSQFVRNKHVCPSNCRDFQMFTPIGEWIFSLMCQHAWGVKGTKSFPLLVLCTFCKQIMSMALQHVQVVFILKCVVIVCEGSFKPSVL